MVYLTKEQLQNSQRVVIDTITPARDRENNIIPGQYALRMEMANDLDPRFVNPELVDSSNVNRTAYANYSSAEIQALARNVGVKLNGMAPDSLKQLNGLAIDTMLSETQVDIEGSQPRYMEAAKQYRIDVDQSRASDLKFDASEHLDRTNQLNDEFGSAFYNLGRGVSDFTKISLEVMKHQDVYAIDGGERLPNIGDAREAVFYAEKALRNGDLSYSDAYVKDVVSKYSGYAEKHMPDSKTALDVSRYDRFAENEREALGSMELRDVQDLGDYAYMQEVLANKHEAPVTVHSYEPEPPEDPRFYGNVDPETLEPLGVEELSVGQKVAVKEVHDEKEPLPDGEKQVVVEPEEKDAEGMFVANGELEPFDRKGKRLFIDGEPQQLQIGGKVVPKYHIPLSLANDRFESPYDMYVKPKLSVSGQWYNPYELNQIAVAVDAPDNYRLSDLTHKAFEGDLERNAEGGYKVNTRNLKAVDDFNYDKHVENTKQVQSTYELWGAALKASGKAMSATAKDVMFKAYQLKEKFGAFRSNLKDEYESWKLDRDIKKMDKEIQKEEKPSMRDKVMSKVEQAYWKRATAMAAKMGFKGSFEFNGEERHASVDMSVYKPKAQAAQPTAPVKDDGPEL